MVLFDTAVLILESGLHCSDYKLHTAIQFCAISVSFHLPEHILFYHCYSNECKFFVSTIRISEIKNELENGRNNGTLLSLRQYLSLVMVVDLCWAGDWCN